MHYNKNKRFIDTVYPIVTQLSEKCFSPKDNPNSACPHCSLNCGRSDVHDPECLLLIGQRIFLKFLQIDSDSSPHFNYKKEKRSEEEILNIHNSLKVSAFLNEIKNILQFLIQKEENDPSNEGVICQCTVFEEKHYNDHTPDCEFLLISNALIELLSK